MYMSYLNRYMPDNCLTSCKCNSIHFFTVIVRSLIGTTAVSGSDDKCMIVWETQRGLALTSLQLHVPFIRFDTSLECSRILIHVMDSAMLPVICLHNTPAQYIKLPTYSAPAQDVEGKFHISHQPFH